MKPVHYAGYLPLLVSLILSCARISPPSQISEPPGGPDAKIPRGATLNMIDERRGADTLIIGDSMVANWPAIDVFALPGQSVPTIVAHAARRLEGQYYDTILLWPGTAHFIEGYAAEAYGSATTELITLALRHSGHVVLLGPMPTEQNAAEIESVWHTYKATVGVPTLDMTTWRQRANPALFVDFVHLSPRGVCFVMDDLRERGLLAATPSTARDAAYAPVEAASEGS